MAQNRKLPTNKGNNKQRGSAKTPKCECMGTSEKVPTSTLGVGGKHRYNAYSENLSDKKSSIDMHTKSKKHEAGMANITRKKVEGGLITEYLHQNAEKLPLAPAHLKKRLDRASVVSFLKPRNL